MTGELREYIRRERDRLARKLIKYGLAHGKARAPEAQGRSWPLYAVRGQAISGTSINPAHRVLPSLDYYDRKNG